jgi:hypothetical protein
MPISPEELVKLWMTDAVGEEARGLISNRSGTLIDVMSRRLLGRTEMASMKWLGGKV